MEKTLGSRFKNAFNAFFSRDPTPVYNYGPSYSSRPDRPRLSRGNERSIITAVYNKIALDVASVDFHHCKVDDNGRYVEDMKSGLNECLTSTRPINHLYRTLFCQCLTKELLL